MSEVKSYVQPVHFLPDSNHHIFYTLLGGKKFELRGTPPPTGSLQS
jgi:hypothetical protein